MDLPSQGLEKVPSGHCGQVDFSARKVTFHSHMPRWARVQKGVCQVNDKKGTLTRGEENWNSGSWGHINHRQYFPFCVSFLLIFT